MDQIERYEGCPLGLAVGDTLGTTLEFRPPGTFEPITDMVGGGPFGLKPGQWTDDTPMALYLTVTSPWANLPRPTDTPRWVKAFSHWDTSRTLMKRGPR